MTHYLIKGWHTLATRDARLVELLLRRGYAEISREEFDAIRALDRGASGR